MNGDLECRENHEVGIKKGKTRITFKSRLIARKVVRGEQRREKAREN